MISVSQTTESPAFAARGNLLSRVRGGPVACKIAGNKAERTEAFRLVYENYVRKGMIPENVYRLRVTEYHMLPTTTIFVARQGTEVIGTVSLIADGDLGLPMDRIQPELVDEARQAGRRPAEVSCLAFRKLEFHEFLPVFIEMTRLMAQFARRNGIGQFLIGCVPRHAQFYCHFLGFEQVGGVRPYATVANTLGVACCLDFDRVDRCRPDCYEQYFGVRAPESKFDSIPMSDRERAAFAHVVELTEQPLTVNA
ncbi:MAG: hypothetical protein KF774_04175 [Planctomyces sp.]|nr:hypothetical protein [Planctomyces sp.]